MADSRGAGASRGADELHNEDLFLVEDSLGLYVVCDGLGSEPGGEVAAFLAVEAIEHYLEEVDETHALVSGSVSVKTIESAIRYALECILEASEMRSDLKGMASTITLLLVQGSRGFVGHTGDSRAYLARRGRCEQLTVDQEWTESDPRSTPSEGIDAPDAPDIETFSLLLEAGDTFILCTDGAEREMENDDLMDSVGEWSPRLIASRIVSAAHRHDPECDATAVVVRIRDPRGARALEMSGPPRVYDGEAAIHRHGDDGALAARRRPDLRWALNPYPGRSDRKSR